MARQLSTHAAAAQQVRAWMRANGYVGRATSDSYSMGSSLNVYVTDLPPDRYAALDQFADQYQYGDFDGMDDSYNYRADRPNLPQVKYVFVNNAMSDEMRQNIWNFARGYYLHLDEMPADYEAARNLRIDNFNCWVSELVYRLFNGQNYNNAYWDYVANATREAA